MAIEAVAMLPSFLLSLYYRDGDSRILGQCALLLLIFGASIWFGVRSERNKHLRLKEGFIIVALGWIILSIGGALPFYFSEYYPTFADALFESVSGFTTTGATVLTQFESFPRGLMFWRATTHWIGGMGVLVLTLAILPKLTGRTSHLVKAESPGPTLSKLVPHTGTTAKILYIIYFFLTVLEFIALLLCGLSPYDAALHAFSTAGTGGFNNYSTSIAAFNNVSVDIVITLFMYLFGVNFAIYFRLLTSQKKEKLSVLQDEEFKWYTIITVLFMLLLTLLNLSYYSGNFLTSLHYSSFQISSVFSTTGFGLADFTQWPAASQFLIFISLFMGSCAGSTAGGIKFIRLVLIAKIIKRAILSTGNPKKILVIQLDKKPVDESMLSQISIFTVVYFLLVILGGFVLSIDNRFTVIEHLTASLTCVSNVGPAFGSLSSSFSEYTCFGKYVCSFLMLAGRLELFPILFLFTRSAWKSH